MPKQLKQERAEQTRRSLMLAAATMFDQVGYERASLAAICESAGVTKGALSFHFASKGELASAVQKLACVESRARLSVLHRPEVPALQTLIDMTELLAELLHTDPVIRAGARLAREYETPQDPAVDCYLCWLELLWNAYLRAEADRSVLPGTCARTVTALAWTVTTGVDALVRSQRVLAATGQAGTIAEGPREWLSRIWSMLLPQVVSPEQRARVRLP
ncbi:ScbR family autoregulator-binding transcription factor [Kitasatospora sp. NPDC052896]|uniref:ScbR family autoregulator-binding transcription factor n=1 Tax=Kitasatospora sp. NPDC052896 TaxID=3364061 RepID=UPI0037C92E16